MTPGRCANRTQCPEGWKSRSEALHEDFSLGELRYARNKSVLRSSKNARGTDQLSEQKRGVAKAASEIENAHSSLDAGPPQDSLGWVAHERGLP
jgi:hypothetical protein